MKNLMIEPRPNSRLPKEAKRWTNRGTKDLSFASRTTETRALLRLQRFAGNQAVTNFMRIANIQRDTPPSLWDRAKAVLRMETEEEKILSQLKTGLARAKRLCEIGAVASSGEAAENLSAAAKHFGDITGTLGKGLKARRIARHVINFVDAIEDLDKITPERMQGSGEAARAFGELFASAGRLGQELPSGPYTGYFKLLAEMSGFFSAMQEKVDPGRRWKRQLDEAMKEPQR